jgi:hypothetical protein
MIFMCLRGMSILRFERMKKKLFFHVYRELGHDGEDSPPCMYHVSDTGSYQLSGLYSCKWLYGRSDRSFVGETTLIEDSRGIVRNPL